MTETTRLQDSLPNESQSDSAQRMYDTRASKYDHSWHPDFARRMVEFAKIKPGQQILDLACGTGLVTIPAAHAAGPHGGVVAVDISKGMLEQAREKVQQGGLTNVEILHHDITRLDELEELDGKCFDVIIMASALVLLSDSDRLRAVKVWFNLLKPGGVFVVDALTPNNQTAGLVFERAVKKLGFSMPYNRDWVKDENSVAGFLENAGFFIAEKLEVEQTREATVFAGSEKIDSFLDEQLKGEHARNIVSATRADVTGVMDGKIRKAFREEWQAVSSNGEVKFEDKVWVFIATKKC